MKKAEQIMQHMHTIETNLGPKFTKEVAMARIFLTRLVFKKPTSKGFKTMMDIVVDFVTSFTVAHPAVVQHLPPEWANLGDMVAPEPSKPKPATANSTATTNYIEYDADGRAKNVQKMALLGNGCDVGLHVALKGDDTAPWKIIEISDVGDMRVQKCNLLGPGLLHQFLDIDFESHFKWRVVKVNTVWGSHYPGITYTKTKEFKITMEKSAIQIAMQELVSSPNLDIRGKPKGVFTTSAVNKDTLKIVAHTAAVKVASEQSEKDAYEITVDDSENY